MIEEMSVQESKNNKTKEEIIKTKHMLYDMRRAAHLHSSQGMASLVQTGSSKALTQSSGTATFPTKLELLQRL